MLEQGKVRRTLAKLRARWADHAPAHPLCLAEEIDPGVTVADFCVAFLLSQRSRKAAKGGGRAVTAAPQDFAPAEAAPQEAEAGKGSREAEAGKGSREAEAETADTRVRRRSSRIVRARTRRALG